MQNDRCTIGFDVNGDRSFSNFVVAHWIGAECITSMWNQGDLQDDGRSVVVFLLEILSIFGVLHK